MPYLLFISHYSNAEISKMYQDLTWLFIKYRLPVVWTTKCSFSVFCKVIFELCGQLYCCYMQHSFTIKMIQTSQDYNFVVTYRLSHFYGLQCINVAHKLTDFDKICLGNTYKLCRQPNRGKFCVRIFSHLWEIAVFSWMCFYLHPVCMYVYTQ